MTLFCAGFVGGGVIMAIVLLWTFVEYLEKRNLYNRDGNVRDLSSLDEEE